MADYLPRQKFPPFLPDLTDQLPGVTVDVQNVVPTNSGWGPFPSFSSFSNALPAPCAGFFYARDKDGTVTVFAGTAVSRLYKLDNTSFTWIDVTQGGVAYTPIAFQRQWSFEQFNDIVIACHGLVNPQKFQLQTDTQFTDLAGNPPQADFVQVVNRFLMLSGIPVQPYRVQWSDLDNITQWTAGVGQADFQDLPDGGRTLGVAGFDLYAVIFQDQMARLMTYAPGSPVIFTITKITGGDGNGLFAPYGWVIDQDNVFWISQEGFKQLAPGGVPQPIGKEMVDRYFFGNCDTSNLQLVISNTDPAASRLYIAFKSTQGQAGLFDIILIYDWRLLRWSRAEVLGQFLTTMQKPGATLENMDIATPGAVNITGAAAAPGGAIRLTVTSTSGMATAAQQTQFGVWNVTRISGSAPFLAAINNVMNTANEAFGQWPISIVNGTQVDLVGSTFAGSYTSGGVLGGNIELIPFPFDTVAASALPALSIFDQNSIMGFFNGPNLEAVIETNEAAADGKRMWVEGFRVISDAPTVFGNVSFRDSPTSPYAYTTEVGLDGFTGTILVSGGGIDTRYARIRIRIPAGLNWTYALGVEPIGELTGRY